MLFVLLAFSCIALDTFIIIILLDVRLFRLTQLIHFRVKKWYSFLKVHLKEKQVRVDIVFSSILQSKETERTTEIRAHKIDK
jgi:hypothetical protein